MKLNKEQTHCNKDIYKSFWHAITTTHKFNCFRKLRLKCHSLRLITHRQRLRTDEKVKIDIILQIIQNEIE